MEIQINKPLKRTKRSKIEERTAYFCLIPAFLGLSFITYFPLIAVFAISFFNWRGASQPVFAGFDNYVRLFTRDPYFIDSIKVTVYFSMITVIGSMLYSLAIALLLNRKIPARGIFRVIFYLPYILPAAAVYIGWSWLYESNFGVFNYVLKSIGINGIMFLNDSRAVVPSLALIAIWQAGNLIVIFLAGLQNIPVVYHEAAEIDGANFWQRFVHVTLPCISPIIFYNLIISLIINMQVVVPALALTSGGPGNSSMFMTYLMYRFAFRQNQLGYASAISFVFFILIALFTIILFITSKSWIFYEEGDD